MSDLVAALKTLGSGRNLAESESRAAVAEIMAGEASESLIAAFLTALKVKGESADELAGAVAAVRDRSTRWDLSMPNSPLLDTCGTGGDGASAVNISTASAVVVAACGVAVAKHGNRSASGNSGSAEVLAELGVAIEADVAILRRCLVELGITFLFAPKFHPAMRFAGPARRLLPFRTLFNLVGPLANPSRPSYQLIGVPDPRLADLVASAIARLGVVRAAVVTGPAGQDEVGLDGPTRVRWVEGGEVSDRTWTVDDFGLAWVKDDDLRVSGPVESAGKLRDLFAGTKGPIRETVLANSAAAMLVAGRVESLAEGVRIASRAIDEGLVGTLMDRWARMSRGE